MPPPTDLDGHVARLKEVVAPGAADRSLTTAEFARRYRVGEDRVRAWIKAGLVRAVNTADSASGKPRYVIPPEALVEFERVRAVAPPTKPVKRRRRASDQVDFFPD